MKHSTFLLFCIIIFSIFAVPFLFTTRTTQSNITRIYSLFPDSNTFIVDCIETDSGLVYGVGVDNNGEIMVKWLPVSICIEEIKGNDLPRYEEKEFGCPRELYLPGNTIINLTTIK